MFEFYFIYSWYKKYKNNVSITKFTVNKAFKRHKYVTLICVVDHANK